VGRRAPVESVETQRRASAAEAEVKGLIVTRIKAKRNE
jgi:hypothetical protein